MNINKAGKLEGIIDPTEEKITPL